MLKRGNRRYLWLGVLFLASLALTLKSSSDQLPNRLRGTRVAPLLSQFGTGNQNVHDISVGVIVGLFIYFLVVWLPERDKRKRVRRNLQLQYDSFKEECIRLFLSAMKGGYDPAEIAGLKKQDQFMQFFNQRFSRDQTRWDAVANGLHAESIQSLLIEFEIFIVEVRFTLIAVDVENEEVFAFLKNLANILYRAKNCSPEYDGVKSLLSLMWSVFAGWSWIEGYAKKDAINEMIKEL